MDAAQQRELAKQTEQIIIESLDRARKGAKSDFITGYAILARSHGFDFGRGDIALVHHRDVPKAVSLRKPDDPVWVNNKLCQPGKCLFVRSHLKSLPVYSGLQS